METQRGQVTSPRIHSQEVAGLGFQRLCSCSFTALQLLLVLPLPSLALQAAQCPPTLPRSFCHSNPQAIGHRFSSTSQQAVRATVPLGEREVQHLGATNSWNPMAYVTPKQSYWNR